jgi:MoaA/NifB/PqqE/SkfB family radical SAM enzyme
MRNLSFVWLEITGRCQLFCEHCYAESGPKESHGSMTRADWIDVIDQAGALGVETVQFIGGEPTLHPDLPFMVDHAVQCRLVVEVFSNLVHVTPQLWNTLVS